MSLYDKSESFGWLMATCSQQMRHRLTKKIREAGLDTTAEQWGVLMHLLDRDGLSQQGLARRYRRSKVAMARLIAALEEQELVARRADPEDRRVNRVFLTELGRRRLPALIALARENLAEASAGVSPGELDVFKRVLRRIIENTR